MRLIDADALHFNIVYPRGVSLRALKQIAWAASKQIDEAPTIDAIPVVKNKDCIDLVRLLNEIIDWNLPHLMDALDTKILAKHLIANKVVIQKQGKWIDTDTTYEDAVCKYNYWECSACEHRIAGRYGLPNYCPYCGARMIGW